MTGIPLLVTWLAVFAGYLPYTMSFAFANPLVILAYAFLAWPLAVSWGRPWLAAGLTLATLVLALVTMNVSSGAPELVLPQAGVLAGAAAVAVTASLAAVSSVRALERAGWTPDRAKLTLRLVFLALAALVYLNRSLPYAWKVWLADHTTSSDLIRFSLGVSTLFLAIFMGTWRKTK